MLPIVIYHFPSNFCFPGLDIGDPLMDTIDVCTWVSMNGYWSIVIFVDNLLIQIKLWWWVTCCKCDHKDGWLLRESAACCYSSVNPTHTLQMLDPLTGGFFYWGRPFYIPLFACCYWNWDRFTVGGGRETHMMCKNCFYFNNLHLSFKSCNIWSGSNLIDEMLFQIHIHIIFTTTFTL